MKSSTAVGTALLLAAIATVAHGAQTYEQAADQVKAAVVFNIAKFSRWETAPRDRLRICTVGQSNLVAALRETIAGKTLHELPVILIEAGADLEDCQIVFVTHEAEQEMERVVASTTGRAILTISEHPRFLERGGMVNLFVRGQRVRFRVNSKAVNRSKVKLSSKLLQLAEIEDH